MKLISFLSAAAVLGLGVFALDLSLSVDVLTSYAVAASVMVMLGVVRDYSTRRTYWEPAPANLTYFPAATASQPARLAA